MDINDLERQLSFKFPERHRRAMLDLSDPIHAACDFLLPASRYELLRIVEVNQFLHSPDGSRRTWTWPPFLIAFASTGCGDYFAYDLRKRPAGIVYVEPERPAAEDLVSDDRLEFESFEEWYESQLRPS